MGKPTRASSYPKATGAGIVNLRPSLRMALGGDVPPNGSSSAQPGVPAMSLAGMFETPSPAAPQMASPASPPGPALRTPGAGMARTGAQAGLASGLNSEYEKFQTPTSLQMANGGVYEPKAPLPPKDPRPISAADVLRGDHTGRRLRDLEAQMQDGGELYLENGGPTGFLGKYTPKMFQVTPQPPAAPQPAPQVRPAVPAPAPAPTQQAAPLPVSAASVMRGDHTANRLRQVEMGMKHGGSRSIDSGQGGHVPGSGEGDKIPAKYEPGEFVVSNAMLDAKPSLRGELRALRKKVLAKQGMTPAEADAKALGGKTLRAQVGVAPQLGYDPSTANRAAEAARQTAYEADLAAKAKASAHARTQAARAMPANAGPANAPAGYRLGQRSGVATAKMLQKAPVVGQALSAAVEAGDVIDVARDKESSKIDVATQAAEGVSKLAGATAGMTAGAAVGGPLTPLTALAGGAAGYLAPELITKGLRYITGQDTDTPIERTRARRDAPSTPSPTAPDANISDAILASEAGKRKSSQLRMAEGPATVVGADGRKYLDSAVTSDDRKQSDAMLNSVMGRRGGTDLRNADINLNLLAGDQNTRDTANAAWAQRGAGIRVDAGPNGTPTFSDSTGPEKMRYTGVDGKPTNEYRNTQQYAEGMQERSKLLAAGAAATAREKAADDERKFEASLAYLGPARAAAARLKRGDTQAGLEGERMKADSLLRTTQMTTDAMANNGRAASAAAVQKTRMDQANSDRTYALEVEKNGVAVADKNRAASESSAKAMNDRMERMWRTNVDGKNVPDAAKIAEYTQNIQATIPDYISQLLEEGTPQALAKAKDLKERRMAALDDTDHEMFRKLQLTKERMKEDSERFFGGTFNNSASLLGSRQKAGTSLRDGTFQTEDGSKTDASNVMYNELGNRFAPDWFKQKDDTLTRGLR